MCTGLPARVLRIAGDEADVESVDGRTLRVSVATPERVRGGDYVLLDANLITTRLSRASALETLGFMKEMAISAAREGGVDAAGVERLFEIRLARLKLRDDNGKPSR